MSLTDLQHWIDARPQRGRLGLTLLFVAALAMLGVGIGEHTSITGKDEYYLSLRTALCMAEQDVWLVPCLDGEPRLKKPPMAYWLSRLSFEVFGVSLVSARLVAVVLASFMILGVVLIARELGNGYGRALLAGAVGLSCMSLFLGGRMLELDVPVACFSTLAFYVLLRWYKRNEIQALPVVGVLLAAGFLTKGPVVLVVCGAGGLALLATDPQSRIHLARHPFAIPGVLLLAAILALPWFYHVWQSYPELTGAALSTELAARDFFKPSLVPVYGFLMLALPWSFLILARLSSRKGLDETQTRQWRFLALWLLFTLLPFFFVRSFERYLYGSLVPAALIPSLLPMPMGALGRWCIRGGLLLIMAAALPLVALALWLAGPKPLLLLGLVLPGWMIYHWWHARRLAPMALSAALCWVYVLGIAYPRLGINEVPQHILEQTRGQDVVFFHGPQPGLLPALLGRSLVHVDQRWLLPESITGHCRPFLVFATEHAGQDAIDGLNKLAYSVREIERFGVLSSRIRWQNMVRQDAGVGQFRQALAVRDLELIKPRVLLLEASAPSCSAN